MISNPGTSMPAETSLLVASLVEAGTAAIRTNADALGDLDRAIGDGDHGVNMLRGFSAIAQAREAICALPLSSALEEMGKLLVMNVGGASGPLYGSLLLAMGRAGAGGNSSLAKVRGVGIAAGKKRGRSDRREQCVADVARPWALL